MRESIIFKVVSIATIGLIALSCPFADLLEAGSLYGVSLVFKCHECQRLC